MQYAEKLRAKLVEISSGLNFAELARDLEPFLFSRGDKKKVELFSNFIAQAEL